MKADVVIVGTPPHLHAEHCIQGLEAGANIICEKPFVSSLAEATRILDVASVAGKQVALNHEFREMPIFQALERNVGKPGVGALNLVQVWQLMDPDL